MRKLAHLQRVAARIIEHKRDGTFGALATTYRKSRDYERLTANTKISYDRYLDRLLVAYADAPLFELTPEDIQERVMDANSDTPGAADMMLTIMRVLYKFAVKRKRGLEDWTAGIDPYGNSSERQPWPEHVLDAAKASTDPLFRLAVKLALYTGQRPGDVCNMTWNAIQGGFIRVRQQKTGTPVEIAMHPELAAELATAKRSDRHLFILSNRQGGPLTSKVFLRWCWQFTHKLGCNFTPHGLRKNATNELFEAGCSAAEVAAITGHKSLSMLEHYGKARSQPKLAARAIGKWTETEQERENRKANGKPSE
ncbi:site-specific integrase [Sphingomonas sp. HH69]